MFKGFFLELYVVNAQIIILANVMMPYTFRSAFIYVVMHMHILIILGIHCMCNGDIANLSRML